MKITFIHHSSFLAETKSLYLLFDYFRGTIPALDPAKPLYVLASHSHSDHYSRKIFDLPATVFLLGHDIDPGDIPPRLKAHILQPHEIYEDDLLKVETMHSTDEGVSFWCTAADGESAADVAAGTGAADGESAADVAAGTGAADGSLSAGITADGPERKQIYHAGDHSNWIWEGTPHNIGFVHMYHEELEHIAGRTADVAMLPLDPRLDKAFPADWYYGHFPIHRRADGWQQPQPQQAVGWALTIQDYMQYADAQVIFPMHQWGQFDLTERFCAREENAAYADRMVRISRDGESWDTGRL